MRYNPPRNYKPPKKRQEDPFVFIGVHIPFELYGRLKALSQAIGRPMSRILVWGLLNELENEENPFANRTKIELPVDSYKEGNHEYEAGVLMMLLKRMPTGAGLDSLMLLAPDLGLTTEQLLHGYMELKAKDEIEEYYPNGSRFKYPDDYRYVRVKRLHHRQMLKDALVSFEGQSLQWSLK